MTPKIVIGRLVTDRKGLPAWMTWYGVAVALLVFAVRQFVDGDTTFGILLALGALVVAVAGRSLAGDAKRTSEIVSPCPVCGVERTRSFMSLRNEREVCARCEACIAYVRVNLDTLEVKEEPLDATNGFYWVSSAQYESVVPRGDDEQRRFHFHMPTMCAVCGAPEAPLLRTLDPMAQADAGFLGAVASEIANDAVGAKASRRYDSNALSSGDELDLQLRDVEMHVCAKHASIGNLGVRYGDGNLAFSSYRHYKAFCELNRIAAEKADQDAAPPTARVVSS